MSKHTPGAEKLATKIQRMIKVWGINAWNGIPGPSRKERTQKIAAIIDKHTAAERDRLREALQNMLNQYMLNQFEKWEGYYQWDEKDEQALEAAQTALAEPEKG